MLVIFRKMSTTTENYDHQSFVRNNVIISTSLGFAFFAIFYSWFPLHLPPMLTLVDRLAFTLKWNVLTVFVLLAIIVHVGNVRFLSAQHNPFKSEDKDKVEVHLRVLQNTLEQFVVSFTLQLITTAWLEESQMQVIPIVVILFVIGRILFWRGYLDPSYGHTKRSRGLPLTAYPSLLMAIFCTYKLFGNCIFNDSGYAR